MESVRSTSVLSSKLYIALNISTQVLGLYASKYFNDWLYKYRPQYNPHPTLSFESKVNAHSMFMAIVVVLFGNGLLLFRLLRSIPRDVYYFVNAVYDMFGVFPLLAGLRLIYTWSEENHSGTTFHSQMGFLAFLLFILTFLLAANGFFALESSEREDSRTLRSYISILAFSLGMILVLSEIFAIMFVGGWEPSWQVQLNRTADYGKLMFLWMAYGSMVLLLTGFRDFDEEQSSPEDSYVVSHIFYPS